MCHPHCTNLQPVHPIFTSTLCSQQHQRVVEKDAETERKREIIAAEKEV
jgi:hypothetical protein